MAAWIKCTFVRLTWSGYHWTDLKWTFVLDCQCNRPAIHLLQSLSSFLPPLELAGWPNFKAVEVSPFQDGVHRASVVFCLHRQQRSASGGRAYRVLPYRSVIGYASVCVAFSCRCLHWEVARFVHHMHKLARCLQWMFWGITFLILSPFETIRFQISCCFSLD